MAHECFVCGKRPLKGHNVSHANNKTIKRSYPNLHSLRILWEGAIRKVRVCTRCIRSQKIVKPPVRRLPQAQA